MYNCGECLDKRSYWTEGSKDVGEHIGLKVLCEDEGLILIECPHCPTETSCTKCGAIMAMNCSIEGCPNK